MAQVVNTNVMSLNAQRNLNSSQKTMSTAIQRLSSSLRINSAKDDAAGLAISERMTAQIRGMNQAVRNANDGISLSQTAEGAMGETTNILQRMRELALQSANSTNNSGDRQAIQEEVNQLQAELNRIANNTEFNGQRILDGSFSGASFQVGANANQTISFAIGSVKASSIGGIAAEDGTEVAAAAATDITISIGGGAATTINSSAGFAGSANGQDATSAYAKAAAINDAGVSGLSVTATTSGTQTVGAIGGTAADTYNLTINGVAVFTNEDVATALSNSDLRDAINGVSDQTGVIASLNGGDLTLTAADGRNITVTESGTGFTAGTDGISVTGGDFDGVLRGSLSISAVDSIAIGGTVANLGLSAAIAKDSLGVDSIDVSTASGAQEAIKRLDSALNSVTSNRAAMGALQNRFESTISNLQNVAENLSAARSRIQDADFAAETANLTKAQILQQAGTAMLAQANSIPQSVLSLLGR
ncbi:flagellin [Legionella taurinensis]|uniref:Flagellin n=1 Tax=Legionella taurinensis TaxID=70611 RepID=A0A3A5LJY5_9GAMM|nr:flagellin [Legionella taurinensis]MDX1836843.1 flagellin [Legionella taurinensis]PUT41260.1 flagellin [Legionella taurinensis]PUT42385.1 flagellin [Legionella taurinensis]PUT43911.1 flagellin [Legionella taurinensis]PUT47166.1 flagellin [Legionella taurinensis]